MNNHTEIIVITHPDCVKHEVPLGHPERPERLISIMNMLAQDLPNIPVLQAPAATNEQVLYAHTNAYLNRLEDSVPDAGIMPIPKDADTWMSPKSLEAARHALGSACMAIDQVMTGKAQAAFSAARPPGHHALAENTMGFCFFANAYIAARHAQEAHGVKRVAIIDFDVHHGNGTAAMISQHKRDDVMFASSHQYPFWPGTGGPEEDDAGGRIINLPLPAGTATAGFQAAWNSAFPRIRAFDPELLVISAGFDAHKDDPLGGLKLIEADFAWITRELKEICPRIVSLLEGGYNLEALAASVKSHLLALASG